MMAHGTNRHENMAYGKDPAFHSAALTAMGHHNTQNQQKAGFAGLQVCLWFTSDDLKRGIGVPHVPVLPAPA
jgi:hypothetical protein